VHFVGRLATYRYYNMDQVVAQALTLVAKMHGERRLDVTREAASAPVQVMAPPVNGVTPVTTT
jgi:UDP-galactopyranose mutase